MGIKKSPKNDIGIDNNFHFTNRLLFLFHHDDFDLAGSSSVCFWDALLLEAISRNFR